MSDLQVLYNFNVLDVVLDPSPARVLMAKLMVERLQVDVPRSLYQCIDVLDQPELYGWDTKTQLMASQIDAVNKGTTLTVRTAMNGKADFGFFPEVPTPFNQKAAKDKKSKEKPAEKPKLPELTPENTFSPADAERLFTRN